MSNKTKFAGYAMHEFYMPTTGEGHKKRRDRRKCEFYNLEHKMCTKLFKPCVGSSVCDKYMEIGSSSTTLVGVNVQSKYYGVGVVVSDNGEFCTVQYKTTKIQCKKETLLTLKNNWFEKERKTIKSWLEEKNK